MSKYKSLPNWPQVQPWRYDSGEMIEDKLSGDVIGNQNIKKWGGWEGTCQSTKPYTPRERVVFLFSAVCLLGLVGAPARNRHSMDNC